jgi:hypothetical protein
MESLIDVLDVSDFGLFILSPDDIVAIRDKTEHAVRDNVIFELGLFVGRLGRERCFVVVPSGADDLHLPTDLLGMTPATFDSDRQDGNMVAALGPACNRIRKAVIKLGPVVQTTPTTTMATKSDEELCSDPEDCKSIIQSWMGGRASHLNMEVMRYDDVDRGLKLKAGSARLYLEEVAKRWGYHASRKGKDTILFEGR